MTRSALIITHAKNEIEQKKNNQFWVLTINFSVTNKTSISIMSHRHIEIYLQVQEIRIRVSFDDLKMDPNTRTTNHNNWNTLFQINGAFISSWYLVHLNCYCAQLTHINICVPSNIWTGILSRFSLLCVYWLMFLFF